MELSTSIRIMSATRIFLAHKTSGSSSPSAVDSAMLSNDFSRRFQYLDRAAEETGKAVRLQPDDPEASIGLAKVFMTMGEPQKAEPLLLHALQLDPTSALAHFRLSTVYRQTERTAEAKQELEQYQKYKQIKEKLRSIYHDLHEQQGRDEAETTEPKR